MKKKLLTASILIGLGGLLIMAGYAFGGKPSVFGGDEDFDEEAFPAAAEDAPLTVLESSGITAMQCKTDVGTLRILAHDVPDFAYRIHNTAQRVKAAVYCEGNTLHIETLGEKRKRFLSFGLWRNDFKRAKRTAVTVYVPRGFSFETVSITSGAVRIAAGDFTAQKQFVLHGGVGEVLVRNVTAAGVQIETGIGENSFTGVLYGHTAVRTGIGETRFRIAGRREDYRLTLDAGIGDIYIGGRRAARGLGKRGSVLQGGARITGLRWMRGSAIFI